MRKQILCDLRSMQLGIRTNLPDLLERPRRFSSRMKSDSAESLPPVQVKCRALLLHPRTQSSPLDTELSADEVPLSEPASPASARHTCASFRLCLLLDATFSGLIRVVRVPLYIHDGAEVLAIIMPSLACAQLLGRGEVAQPAAFLIDVHLIHSDSVRSVKHSGTRSPATSAPCDLSHLLLWPAPSRQAVAAVVGWSKEETSTGSRGSEAAQSGWAPIRCV